MLEALMIKPKQHDINKLISNLSMNMLNISIKKRKNKIGPDNWNCHLETERYLKYRLINPDKSKLARIILIRINTELR